MRVFYTDIEEFKKKYDKTVLMPYSDINIKTEKRFYEYTLGRYLVSNVLKEFYNIKNPKIILNKNGKPFLEGNEVYFSLSHSKNIVIACFDKYPCGIDIEYIKPRNLKNLSKYLGQNFSNLEDFYKYWTQKEAEYKLDETCLSKFQTEFMNNYCLTIVSALKKLKNITIEKFCNKNY